MTTKKDPIPHQLLQSIWFWVLVLAISLMACNSKTGNKEGTTENEETLSPSTPIPPKVVKVITKKMDLNLPTEIPAGWVTFIYENKSDLVHFFVLEKLPEGKSLTDSQSEVIPIFQSAMDKINDGEVDKGLAEFEKLPPWFFEVKFCGGPGLLSGKHTSETTLKVEPGYYVIECYVKMPNGQFHSYAGMLAEFTATPNDHPTSPPKSNININLSSEKGIQVRNDITSGKHVIAVYFDDQKAHEHFVGHDLHLVRLQEGADTKELASWMNWMNPDGFSTPQPEGVEFLGGTQEMSEGNTAYFTADIKPGKYAWIAEVPSPVEKNMLKIFTVEE